MKIRTRIGGKTYFTKAIFLLGMFSLPAFVFATSASTYSVSAVSGSCAMLQGYSDVGNRWFEIKEINKNMEPITIGGRQSFFSSNSGAGTGGNFQVEATKLRPNTQYVYRAVAQTGGTIAYGQESSFTTKSAVYEKNPNGDSFVGCSNYVPMTTNTNVVVDIKTGEVIPSGSVSLNQGNQTTNYSTSIPYYYGSTQGYYQNSITNYTNRTTVTTLNAADIRNTSAILGAKIYPSTSAAQYGKFLWGRTPSFGNVTERIYLGSGSTVTLSQQITGLMPGTVYYYKPIVDDQVNSSEGPVFLFTTTSNTIAQNPVSNLVDYDIPNASYYTTPTNRNVAKTSTNPVISKNNANTSEKTQAGIVGKTIVITNETNIDAVAPGDTVKKTFTFTNSTGEKLTNVVVKAVLPDGETFVSKNSDNFTADGQLITYRIGDMAPGQKISLSYFVNISKDAKDGTTLNTMTIATAKNASGTQINTIIDSTLLVDKNIAQQKNIAAAVFANNNSFSIFPKTLTDWFTIIILLFVFTFSYFIWKFYVIRKERMEDDEIPDILGVDPRDVPKKPILPVRKFVKDPFYGNNKKESLMESVQEEEQKVVEMVANTVKSAPPDNLPI